MKTKYGDKEACIIRYKDEDRRVYCVADSSDVAKAIIEEAKQQLNLYWERWVIYEEDKDA